MLNLQTNVDALNIYTN